MRLDDVKSILATSSQEDWIIDDESGSFTFKNDLNLRIERAEYDSFRDFNEPWATSHPDKHAVAVDYVVKYGSSFVDKKMLVSVDGHRATLPLPKSINNLCVKASDVNFAKIVNIGDTVDDYLKRSNIRIESDD